MPDAIVTGTGNGGYMAGVNKYSRLDVSSAASPRIYYESRDRATAFGISTPLLTLTTTGGRVLYVKNTSSTKHMVVTDIRVDWNGGSTNFNRPLYGQIWFASTAPTANNTTSAAAQMNRSQVDSFDLDVEYWDEVGDGMTIAGGAAGFNTVLAQGSLLFPINGAIIIGVNKTISLNMRGEEIGEAAATIIGFMEDKR